MGFDSSTEFASELRVKIYLHVKGICRVSRVTEGHQLIDIV